MTPPDALKSDVGKYPLDSGTFRLDRLLGDKNLEAQLLKAVVELPELNELRVVLPYLAVENVDSQSGRFHVVVKGVPNSPLVFQRAGSRFELDKDSEEVFVQDPLFAKKYYLEGLRSSPQINKYFDDLAKAIAVLPEDYLATFFKNAGEELNLRLFGGSVPDADLKALVLSKKQMLLAKLGSQVGEAKSFSELADIRHKTFDPGLIDIEILTRKIVALNLEHQRSGHDWSKEEVKSEVLEQILKIGLNSYKSADLLEQFMGDVFGRLLAANSTGSKDFYTGLNVVNAYMFYVSEADSELMDKVDYSKLSDPNSADGLRRIQYHEYVQRAFLGAFPSTNPKIRRFKDWKDIVDTSGLASLEKAELTTEFAGQFKNLIKNLERIGGVKYGKLDELYQKVFTPNAAGDSQASKEMDNIIGLKRGEQLAYIQERIRAYNAVIFLDSEYWRDVSTMERARVIWKKLFN